MLDDMLASDDDTMLDDMLALDDDTVLDDMLAIASKSTIRYPTREWFKEHLLVPSNHIFKQVDVQTLTTEGVVNRKMNRVEG
eukprot:3029691-Amphidinium_carterae.1